MAAVQDRPGCGLNDIVNTVMAFPAVVIPVIEQHYTILARNLLYTGVTQGKKLVVLVGQRKAIAMAVRNGGQRQRWSKLEDWLRM